MYISDHAMNCTRRSEVGKDGETSPLRAKGYVTSALDLEIGARVSVKVATRKMMAKLTPKWGCGIFVGVRPRTTEIRSVRRLPDGVKWSWCAVRLVRRVMWNTFQGDETADGDISDGTTAEPQAEEMKGGQAHQGLTIITRRQVPRLSCTTKKDAEKHGCTRVVSCLWNLVLWCGRATHGTAV